MSHTSCTHYTHITENNTHALTPLFSVLKFGIN